MIIPVGFGTSCIWDKPIQASIEIIIARERYQKFYADYEDCHVCFCFLGRQNMKKIKGSCVLDRLIIQ